MSSHRFSAPTLLALLVAVVLAVAACGGASTATQTPGATASTSPSDSPLASASPDAGSAAPTTGTTDGLGGAAGNLSNIESYQFKIVMSGGTFGTMLGSAPIIGTVTTNPKAAQMNMMGMDIVEVDGKTWVKFGEQWIESTDENTSSLADSFSPDAMFGSTLSGAAADGYHPVGDEDKNGVATVHYTADTTVLSGYGDLFGVGGSATWSADVWVAKDGGYPVSMAITATGGDESFEMTFDITNINDPSNKVEQPN
jgi:hypothetical protein